MKSEWRLTRIGNICKTNQQTYSLAELWPFVNYLDTGNITENRISEMQYLITGQDVLPSRARRKVAVDDILYSTVRPNQRHYGIVKDVLPNMLVSTGFAVITVDKSLADSDFLYYYLTQNDIVNSLHSIGEQSVSAYPSIKPSDIEGLEMLLPPLSEQIEIGRTLRALDDKIANNTAINRHLEQMAQTIFKSWFVDFEPWGGVMPEDWRDAELGEVTTLSAGGDKPAICSPSQTDECSIPIFSNGIDNFGLYGYTDRPKVIDECVTVSARGTIGYVCLRQDPFVPIVRLVTAIPNNKYITAKYLYLYLSSIHIAGVGTTQQQLTVPDFKKYRILVPALDTVEDFTRTSAPMFEAIRHKRAENAHLATIRDTLLPRLMSGEMSVSCLEVKR